MNHTDIERRIDTALWYGLVAIACIWTYLEVTSALN